MSSRRTAWYRKHRVHSAEAPSATQPTVPSMFYWLTKDDIPLWWKLVRFSGCVAWEVVKECGRALVREADRVAETVRHLMLMPLVVVFIYANNWQSYLGWCA